MTRQTLTSSRARWVAVAIAVLLIGWVVGVALWGAGRDPSPVGSPEQPRGSLESPKDAPEVIPEATAAPEILEQVVQEQIAQLRAMPKTEPDPRLSDRIPSEARSHPDLYAAEFVRVLLTQDYGRPRQEILTWVATEAATTAEPLVVGLVPPELRDRLAVYSVAEQSSGPDSSPVPSAAEWARLAALRGYTTVTDIRVSEPLAWSNAVDAGRVTDPGVTAREITATVTLHTTAAGVTSAARSSVSLIADFVGPPTRPSWGFVNVVLYTSLPEGRS
ncbi:hypothetical protein [Intrasporangium calvum]|uniref:hypothetical protein n=1 Tax=Intrasporangium calvum TaxID=53358 RepID=UPI0012378377|nr:hypothetical protein [Intrasporangium calvum]